MNVPDPARIVESLSAAQNRRDLQGVLSYFADDAVLRFEPPLPPAHPVYRGKQEIREYLRLLLADPLRVEVADIRATGNEVIWRARVSANRFRALGIDPAEVSHHALLEGGLIRSLTITYSPETARRMEEALAAHEETS